MHNFIALLLAFVLLPSQLIAQSQKLTKEMWHLLSTKEAEQAYKGKIFEFNVKVYEQYNSSGTLVGYLNGDLKYKTYAFWLDEEWKPEEYKLSFGEEIKVRAKFIGPSDDWLAPWFRILSVTSVKKGVAFDRTSAKQRIQIEERIDKAEALVTAEHPTYRKKLQRAIDAAQGKISAKLFGHLECTIREEENRELFGLSGKLLTVTASDGTVLLKALHAQSTNYLQFQVVNASINYEIGQPAYGSDLERIWRTPNREVQLITIADPNITIGSAMMILDVNTKAGRINGYNANNLFEAATDVLNSNRK